MLKVMVFINEKLTKAINMLMILLMSSMVVFVFAQVIYRYVLLKPLSWSEELASYLFSGIIFFGSVLLFRESRHINMSLLVDSIKIPFIKNLLVVVAHLLSFYFLAVLVYYSFPMALLILRFEVVSPSMNWLKIGYVFLIVPVASLLSLFVLLEVIIKSLIDLKEKK